MATYGQTKKYLLLGLSLLAASACERPTPSEVAAPTRMFSQTAGATLVECPTDQSSSTSATVDIKGGTVSLDGHSITLPYGAVLLPTELTLSVPASNYMEISITANGQESFTFEKPVSVTISYARCTRSNINKAALSAWYIDGTTKALLENMGGTDNKETRTVTFGTGHLSEYAIAN